MQTARPAAAPAQFAAHQRAPRTSASGSRYRRDLQAEARRLHARGRDTASRDAYPLLVELLQLAQQRCAAGQQRFAWRGMRFRSELLPSGRLVVAEDGAEGAALDLVSGFVL